MSALARGTCPACNRTVALRRNGVLREHYVYRLQSEQDPSAHMGRMRVCDGSGKAAA